MKPNVQFALPLAVILAAAPASAEQRPSGAEPGVISRAFSIEYARGRVWNPWTLSHDQVELRAFRGEGTQEGLFVAPTVRLRPGQTLRIALENRLPACSEAQQHAHSCYNDTNLHTHGLWVSPAGNSDNVLISISPGRRFQYEYNIASDHPAGTYWYHPHRHGGGFVQVGSGMAGALIVTGDRLPSAERPGDIDILLRDSRGPFAERVMLFQQIQYACLDEAGAIPGQRLENGDYVRPWACPPGGIGRIESPEHDWDWRWSGRFTGINGEVQPVLRGARAGRFERWRMVHAGTREPVRMRIHRLTPGAPDLRTIAGTDQAEWIAAHCAGPPLPTWEIALDGLTRSQVRRTDRPALFPGDRLDVLTYFPTEGRYCMIQEGGPAGTESLPPRVLGIVEAGPGDPAAADPSALLQAKLIAAAQRALPGSRHAPVRERVVGELAGGMRLGAFVWHRPVEEAELTGFREAVVNVLETSRGPFFHFNGRPYEEGRIDQMLPLGGVEEWHVTSLLGDHPLHIHVNPFQIVSIVDSQGRDVTDANGPTFDPDYAGLVGEWKDTLLIKEHHRAVLRTRYERFVGDFVIHCHIMFHGDHGMMQNLRIYLPGGPDAPPAHH
jgi:FtsP/CotA-like multicopper oxidase with cupredoxin domain